MQQNIIARNEEIFNNLCYGLKVRHETFNHNIPDVLPNIFVLAENKDVATVGLALNYTSTLYRPPERVEIVYDSDNTSTDSYYKLAPRPK